MMIFCRGRTHVCAVGLQYNFRADTRVRPYYILGQHYTLLCNYGLRITAPTDIKLISVIMNVFKATPHNYRLTAMCVSCLNFFRHSTQKLLVMRPKEVPLGYDSIPASFLCTLTKKFTSQYSHINYAVLP